MIRGVLISGVILLGILSGCGEADHPSLGGPVPLYVTDTPGDQFPGVEITLFAIDLCSDHDCVNTVNLYDNPGGLSIQLAELNGIHQLIGIPDIPAGTFNRLEVVLGQTAVVTDAGGNAHPAYFDPETENFNKANVVLCPPGLSGRCLIRFNGAVQPFAMGRLVVDFVLKDFEVDPRPCPGVADPASWCMTEVKMKPLTPGDMDGMGGGPEYKITGTISAFLPTYISVSSGSTEYAVVLTGGTKCKIDGAEFVGAGACVANLKVGDCVAIKTPDDPGIGTALEAREIETEAPSNCQ